jgi:hypothetical protein
MGLDTGRAGAKRYPPISTVRSGSDGGDQHREGLTAAGGAESRLEGGNRRNLKFTTLNTHYKPGLALELKSSPREREGKQIK